LLGFEWLEYEFARFTATDEPRIQYNMNRVKVSAAKFLSQSFRAKDPEPTFPSHEFRAKLSEPNFLARDSNP
jgi:hypothetical protein